MKIARHSRLLALAACVAASASVGWAADAPTAGGSQAALVQELEGKSPAAARTPDQWVSAYTQALDALLPDMGSDDLARQGPAQDAWEQIAFHAGRPGADVERKAVSQAMAARLGPETPQVARVWLERKLEQVGGAEAVAPLAKLLSDPDPVVRDTARRTLQNNPSEEALDALRTALAHADNVPWQVALINSLGYRKDAASVPAFTTLLASNDPALITAAADALARIGDPASAATLASALEKAQGATRTALYDSEMAYAENLQAANKPLLAPAVYQSLYAPARPEYIRIAGLRGLVMTEGAEAAPLVVQALTTGDDAMQGAAASFIPLIPGPEATRAFAAALPKLPPSSQARLVRVLGERGDAAAKPAVLALIKSPDGNVQVAALRALGQLGDATDVTTLVTAAAGQGPAAAAAQQSLAALRGADVNALMADLLKPSSNAQPAVRVELLRALAARHAAAALPALLQAANDPNMDVKSQALDSLGTVGDDSTVPVLVSSIVRAKDDRVRGGAVKALSAVCLRSANRDACADTVLAALPAADKVARQSLLGVLPSIGGAKALDAVRTALKDPDQQVHEAAVHALADWTDAAAGPDLLDLARNSTALTDQVLGLRGYIRLVGLSNLSPADRLKQYQDALTLAKRPDEKKLALAGLGAINTVDALQTVAPYLDDPALTEEAAAAVVQIVGKLRGAKAAQVQPVLQKVLDVARNRRTRGEATRDLARYRPRNQG